MRFVFLGKVLISWQQVKRPVSVSSNQNYQEYVCWPPLPHTHLHTSQRKIDLSPKNTLKRNGLCRVRGRMSTSLELCSLFQSAVPGSFAKNAIKGEEGMLLFMSPHHSILWFMYTHTHMHTYMHTHEYNAHTYTHGHVHTHTYVHTHPHHIQALALPLVWPSLFSQAKIATWDGCAKAFAVYLGAGEMG